jgi:magnesium transporter
MEERKLIRAWLLGEQLRPLDATHAYDHPDCSLYLTNEAACPALLERLHIVHEDEVNLKHISICKAESLPDLIYGTLAVPRLTDALGTRRRILLFITAKTIVIVDDSGFIKRLIANIRRKRVHQAESKGRLLYNLIIELLGRGTVTLDEYENALFDLEEELSQGKTEGFLSRLQPLRKTLLILRSYYDQLGDMMTELADNETGLFDREEVSLFRRLFDRTGRLMDRASFLLDYALQLRDTYQSRIDARQNDNMQFLTIISVIFLPLTVITGWYGMNFENMPELSHGYPYVIILSVVVILIGIWIFKHKKIL